MKPELLAPAGSPEALRAAVQNGADAVYLGWGEFNARRSAKNFTDSEFADAMVQGLVLQRLLFFGVFPFLYPALAAVLSTLEGTVPGTVFSLVLGILCDLAMNFLGTHDTARILTELGAKAVPQSRDGRALYRLTEEERRAGTELLKVAVLLLFTFPGSPTVYYGDEAGMEGFEDPFNRGAYPWDREDEPLKDWFTRLGQLRRERESLQSGSIEYLFSSGAGLAFRRQSGDERSMDLAVGVVIGGAFTAIVNAVVKDIINPIVSLFSGGIDFSTITIGIFPIGDLIMSIINFLIVALVVFLMVKAMKTGEQTKLGADETAALILSGLAEKNRGAVILG